MTLCIFHTMLYLATGNWLVPVQSQIKSDLSLYEVGQDGGHGAVEFLLVPSDPPFSCRTRAWGLNLRIGVRICCLALSVSPVIDWQLVPDQTLNQHESPVRRTLVIYNR